MADKTGLGLIGLMLGGATLMVMMIGGVVVTDHLTGRLQFDEMQVTAVDAPVVR